LDVPVAGGAAVAAFPGYLPKGVVGAGQWGPNIVIGTTGVGEVAYRSNNPGTFIRARDGS
jgi:hypothetical protein